MSKKGRGRRIFKPFVLGGAPGSDFPSLGGAPGSDFPSLGGAPGSDFPSLGGAPGSDFRSLGIQPQTSQFSSLGAKLSAPVELPGFASAAIKPITPAKDQFADFESTSLPVKQVTPVTESPPVTSKLESQMQSLSLTNTSPEKSDKVRVLNGEFPAKRGRGTLGRTIRLRTNHFKLKLAKPLTIWQYDVDVEMLHERKNNQKMGDNKRECAKDKELMRDFFKTFCEKNLPVQYRNKVVFNFSKNMFSLIKFPFEDKMEFNMHFDTHEYLVKIKPINTVQINFQNMDDLLGIHIMDLIMTNNFNYSSHIVNRSFFTPNCSVQQLNFGLELWRGAYASVRPSECGLTWNVDSANAAFLTCVDLLELAAHHYQCDYVNLKAAIEKDRDAKEYGTSFLKLYRGRKIRTMTGFKKRITGFGPDTNFKFPLKEGNKPEVQISVKDYLKKQYNISLKYPQLPCVNLGKTNYLPMELCKTELSQKKNLSEKETADIIKSTAIKATDRLDYIQKWVNSSSIVNDPILKEYNVNLEFKMVELDGRVLSAPDIQYNQRSQKSVVKSDEIATKGAWDHRNLQFVNPKPLKKWVILNLSRSNKIDKLEYELINVGKVHGMQVAKATEVIQKGNRVQDREVNNIMVDIIKKYHNPREQSRLELIVVVLQGSTSTYKCIKTMGDINYGIPTQIVDEKTVFKLNGMTASNILLKINAKINGRNFLLYNNPSANNLFKHYLQGFFKETMIFGADVTHPAPQQGDLSTESIAAVTASLDRDCCYYAARLYAQRSPTGQAYEMIHDLDKMFNDLILEYHRLHHAFPKRIFFYRDGVSEGQFSLVLRHEMNKIRNACQNISSGYKPAITFIIVQKRHHTRFLPTDPRMQNGRANNVPPGTVVDNTVVSENMFDYFLCSHSGIQGTSRPCRYYVLHDDNHLSTDQAQLLSHYLCHIYSRCSRSVSFPAPAYYSHLAAFRGRNYLRKDNNSLDKSKVTSYEIKLHPDIKNLMFYI